jgi:hypothetical protein
VNLLNQKRSWRVKNGIVARSSDFHRLGKDFEKKHGHMAYRNKNKTCYFGSPFLEVPFWKSLFGSDGLIVNFSPGCIYHHYAREKSLKNEMQYLQKTSI